MEGKKSYDKVIQEALRKSSMSYQCKVSISTKTQRVYYVEFTKEKE